MFDESVLDEQPESFDVSSDLVNDILSGVSDLIFGVLDGESDASPVSPIIIFNSEVPPQEDPVEPEILPLESEEEVWIYDEEYGLQTYAVSPITSADGLKGVLLDVLGDYDAIVVEYRYLNSNNTSYSYIREIQPDFPWLCSAGIFLALLWSIFTVGGRLICRK